MGKGIALQFKEQFPLNYKLYRAACKNKEVVTGKMFTTATEKSIEPFYIVNFPTKQHWRNKSKLEFVEKGLDDLVLVMKEKNISSIAIPPLGCGNGGLDWSIVKPLIEQKLKDLAQEANIIIFEPSTKQLAPKRNRKSQTPPKLTPLRAILLDSMFQYKTLDYDLTVLEVQKLGYLLQRLGNKFNLKFVKHLYGPYSNQLRYVLNDLDGFYLHGMQYNNAKPYHQLSLIPEHRPSIQAYIEKNCTTEQKNSLANLYQLIDGFESPLGMELLATIDLLITENKDLLANTVLMQQQLEKWSERKSSFDETALCSVHHRKVKNF